MENNLKIININEKLLEAQFDLSVGIKIAHLLDIGDLSQYVAEIGSNKKVGAHYHSIGSEIYQIIEGVGEIHIGKVFGKNKVDWVISKTVKQGDCFTIREGEAHQLVNKQNEKLIIQFICSKSHLLDDRTMVSDYRMVSI